MLPAAQFVAGPPNRRVALPDPQRVEANARLAELAGVIAGRVAVVGDPQAVEWALTAELFDHDDFTDFVNLGGLAWTAERAISIGEHLPFVATAHLGSLVAQHGSSEAASEAATAGADLQAAIYDDRMGRLGQRALQHGLEAAVAVVALLTNGRGATPAVRGELERWAMQGSREYLGLLLAAVREHEIALPPDLESFVVQLDVVAIDPAADDEQSDADRAAAVAYLRRVAR